MIQLRSTRRYIIFSGYQFPFRADIGKTEGKVRYILRARENKCRNMSNQSSHTQQPNQNINIKLTKSCTTRSSQHNPFQPDPEHFSQKSCNRNEEVKDMMIFNLKQTQN